MVYRVNRDPIIDNNRTLRVDRMRVGSFSQRIGFQGETSGYSSGGNIRTPFVSSVTNIIDKFPFSTDQGATDVGDLTQKAYSADGTSSTTHGYTHGGRAPSGSGGPYLNTIQKYSFTTDGNSTDVGDLIATGYGAGPNSSTTHGYASGLSPSYSNVIQKYSFTSDGNSTDVGDLTLARYGSAGQSSTASGYTSGGASPPTDVIDKSPFSSDANAADVGDLTTVKYQVAGQSSINYGYTSGGFAPPLSPSTANVIDKFPFSTDANATDVGDLTVARYGGAGQQV